MPLPAISLAVVGVNHPNKDKSKSNRRFEIALCKPGDPVELRPEPKNIADDGAVAVFSNRGIQIGYLTAERCGRIGALIREGCELRAVFQRDARHGAWIRVAFDGEEPVVDPNPAPTAAEAKPFEFVDAEPEFVPDPEWPDD